MKGDWVERVIGVEDFMDKETGQKRRLIQEYVPGKQVTLAHVIAHPAKSIFEKLGLTDTGAIGILTLTPGETAIIAADLATKAAPVEIGFLDRFTGALFATSLEAEVLLFIQDATRKLSVFPPGFAGAFTRRTLGVITKTDHPEADVAIAGGFLKSLGLTGPVVAVSVLTGDGMEELRKTLQWD